MFRTSPLSIIRSISTLHTLIGICRASSVGCLLALSGPDHSSRQLTELAWQIPIACIQCWYIPDDGQWTCPKHARSVDCLLAWSGPNHAIMTNTYCVYTVLKYPTWWTVDLSETYRIIYQINLRNSASRWSSERHIYEYFSWIFIQGVLFLRRHTSYIVSFFFVE